MTAAMQQILEQRFAAGFERRIGELALFVERSDFDALALGFHSLAGIGGTYGHQDVTEVARDGEEFAARHDVGRIRAVIAELEHIRSGLTKAA
jgi:hypothetical protein